MPDTEPEDDRALAERARREAEILQAGAGTAFWCILEQELEYRQASLVAAYDKAQGERDLFTTQGKRQMIAELLNLKGLIAEKESVWARFEALQQRNALRKQDLPPIQPGL